MKLADGKIAQYLVIVGLNRPSGSTGPKYKSISVEKHGLFGALRIAADLRAEMLGGVPVSDDVIRKAEASVQRKFPQFFENGVFKKISPIERDNDQIYSRR